MGGVFFDWFLTICFVLMVGSCTARHVYNEWVDVIHTESNKNQMK